MADQADSYEENTGNPMASPVSFGDMDERIATLLHLQQLQQKQEVIQLMESHTVTNADAEFRCGLEELVRDHFNTCMALASCSSAVHDPGISSSSSNNVMSRPSSYNAMHGESDDTHHSLHESDHNLHPCNTAQSHESDDLLFQRSNSSYGNAHHHISDHEQSDDEQENTDQLVQEQREADGNLVDDHSSVEERSPSRILTNWAAQRAQEMITMERQEVELHALSHLHTVSTLDASFLRESPTRVDPSMGREARQQHRRPSSMVQMWRELEEETRTERARNDTEERMSAPTESSNSLEGVENLDSRVNLQRADGGVEQTIVAEARAVQTQVSEDTEDLLQSRNSDFSEWELNGTERIDIHDHEEVSERHSAQVQEGEREHVRQIVQRLMTDNGMQTISTDGQTRNRSAWLDENERERVRELAREWVRVTNEQRSGTWERGGRQRLQTLNGLGQARERRLAPERENRNENLVQGLSRSEQRFFDRRQVFLDMLMRGERERQRELQLLVEHRAVSDFAHRHRLQSFLRGRFLRTGAVSEEERIPSSAAGELGQLRQRRAVSDLREGFRFRLETILQSQANSRLDTERANAHDAAQRRRRGENQPVFQPLAGGNPIRRGAPSGLSRGWQGIATARRATDFQTVEQSTAYNVELQELLGRRSVTNVLASEFRDRLDQLIGSFLQTQGHSPVAWGFRRRTARTGTPQQQQQQQQATQRPRQAQNRQPAVIPPPPPPPPQPVWQQEVQQGTWPRPPPSLHRPSGTMSLQEVEGINDLRTDVTKLRQGMSDFKRMMETCIEMQLDLQRSVRQELAGALQQMYDGKAVPEEAIDGSKWVSVKTGICCVCCDRNIDSLLYRCGHMCTCLKCASELIRNSGKCPMCRAPILEVVRAFTVA